MSYTGFVTFCYVADLERTARFYQDVVGLELALDQGTCRIYAVTDTAFVGFCTRDDAPRPAGVILTFLCDDVEATCARLVERGATLDQQPKHNQKYDIVHAFLRDPDGYLIEIQRFTDPRWSGP